MTFHEYASGGGRADRQTDSQQDRQMDRHDEANRCLSQFCERT
jgi:hypothetical protein